MIVNLLLLLSFGFVLGGEPDANRLVTVKTSIGTLVGQKAAVQNRTVNVFYGVPYSEAPVGERRFRRTRLIRRLPEDPYKALRYKAHCAQRRTKKYAEDEPFSEDCLHLNVWTPNLADARVDGRCKRKFPVMIYFFGGTSSIFQKSPFLDANNRSHLSYNGEYFATRDTILVSVNFRQELFASLYLEGEFGANLAYFDQNLAIRWVKQHIARFCGDDENLTLFGNSLGAMATGIHIISKYSKHLISNAIMQSSSPLFHDIFPATRTEIMLSSFAAIQQFECVNLTHVESLESLASLNQTVKDEFFSQTSLKSKYFLRKLKQNLEKLKSKLKRKPQKSDEKQKGDEKPDDQLDENLVRLVRFLSKHAVDVECLQNLPMQTIADNANLLPTPFYFDFDFVDTEAYLNYKLFNRLSFDPKINILSGVVTDESCFQGLAFKEFWYTDQFNPPALSKQDAWKLIQSTGLLRTKNKRLSNIMADFYTDESRWDLTKGYYESFTNLVADWQFVCPAHMYTNFAAYTANSVSAYVITQPSSRHWSSSGGADYTLEDYNWMGPCHADELLFLWSLPYRVPNQFTDMDRHFSTVILDLWTSFAKNGQMPRQRPTGKRWPISSKQRPSPRYVELNSKYIREHKFEFEQRCDLFWKPLLPLYAK